MTRVANFLVLVASAAVVFLLVDNNAVYGQKSEAAIPTYAENGKLISLTNLSPLSDCTTRSAEGKVSSVKVEGESVRVRIEKKKEDADVQVPLGRIASDDREFVFRDLIKKKIILRVAGYSCEPDVPILAFSIDRVY